MYCYLSVTEYLFWEWTFTMKGSILHLDLSKSVVIDFALWKRKIENKVQIRWYCGYWCATWYLRLFAFCTCTCTSTKQNKFYHYVYFNGTEYLPLNIPLHSDSSILLETCETLEIKNGPNLMAKVSITRPL